MKQLLFTALITGALLLSNNQAQAQCYSAVQLDGTNQYLHTPFSNYNFSNFTIEMWINSADFSPNDVYVNLNINSYIALGGWAPDGSFNTWAEGLNPNSINSGSGTTPAVNTWHHIAYVYDGTNQIIYIDGVAVQTTPTSSAVIQGNGQTHGLVIGARFDGGQQYTNTAFDDVRIWGVARSSAELNANMNSSLTGAENSLFAYYRFEDGAGSSTVTDLTGNGNTLTMNNMDPATDWITGPFSTASQSTDVINHCGPLTWIDGNTYSSDNNTAVHTFVGGAAGGCDSIVTLDLTVNALPDSSVTTNNFEITSNESGAGSQYQWIDCNNGSAAISGETSQTYTATTTGYYAVVVTGANGCSDTSACVEIAFASLNESSLGTGITLSPNPTNGAFSISTDNYSGDVIIEVTNLTGKVIFKSEQNLDANSSVNLDLTGAANGVYIVNVSDRNEVHSMRVIKK